MNAELPIALVEPRDFTAALGGLVRALRQRADWTQSELASRSGGPVSTLSRLERTGLASTDRLARGLFALDALDAFQDFLAARRGTASGGGPMSVELSFRGRCPDRDRLTELVRAAAAPPIWTAPPSPSAPASATSAPRATSTPSSTTGPRTSRSSPSSRRLPPRAAPTSRPTAPRSGTVRRDGPGGNGP